VQEAPADQLVTKVQMALMVMLAHLDPRVSLAQQEEQDPMVVLDRLVPRDQLDHRYLRLIALTKCIIDYLWLNTFPVLYSLALNPLHFKP